MTGAGTLPELSRRHSASVRLRAPGDEAGVHVWMAVIPVVTFSTTAEPLVVLVAATVKMMVSPAWMARAKS